MTEPVLEKPASKYDVIGPGHTFGSVTDKISAIVLTRRTPKGWLLGFSLSFLLMMLLFYAIAHAVRTRFEAASECRRRSGLSMRSRGSRSSLSIALPVGA